MHDTKNPKGLYASPSWIEGEVFLNDTLVGRGALRRLLEDLRASTGEDRMVLRADQEASHGDVVEMIDLIKQSGFTRVSLSARTPAGR